MKLFLKINTDSFQMQSAGRVKKITAAILCVAVFVGIALCGYTFWYSKQAKFHDVTVELGTPSVSLRDFMTEYARADKVGFVSDVSVIDLNRVGQTQLTLRYDEQE